MLLETIDGETEYVLFQVALLGLNSSSNDSFWCVDMVIWRDCTVGVWKGGFMFETLKHLKFGPNVVLETFWSYIYIYM